MSYLVSDEQISELVIKTLEKELYSLVKSGLVDVGINDDGQWVYIATEYAKSLTQEELFNIIFNKSQSHD